MSLIRLDKFLADSGLGTRSQVKQLLKQGTVTVNGETVKKPEQKINTEADDIVCRGKCLTYTKYFYYMLHKPAGFVSATDDNTAPTVLSLLKDAPGKGLFPVGRLDKDTEGLLLITNDGPLAHRLLSPRNHVDKTYFVRAEGKVTKEAIERLEKGIDIGEDTPTLPARAELLSYDQVSGYSEVLLAIHEGKFHQVKRMFQAIGNPVLYLKRLSMGGLKLDEALPKGSFRPLSQEEIDQIKKE